MTALRAVRPNSGVRRPVVRARVGLELDDPPDAAAGVVVADQARAEQARVPRSRGR